MTVPLAIACSWIAAALTVAVFFAVGFSISAGCRSVWRRVRRAWWSEWVGNLDGRPTMWVTPLLSVGGCRVDLHKFVHGDDPRYFHTHPAWAVSVVLTGGYIEEREDGTRHVRVAPCVVLVRPSLSHRVAYVFSR